MINKQKEQQQQAEHSEISVEPEPPRLDVVYGTLQNRRRRLILRYLENESSAAIGDLAEHVAAIENDVPRHQVESTQRKRVYVSLYQSHLPKLDEAGAVSYDGDRGTVELLSEAEEFLDILDRSENSTACTAHAPAIYSLASALFLTAALVTVSVSPADEAILFGLGTVAVLIVSAAILVTLVYGLRVETDSLPLGMLVGG